MTDISYLRSIDTATLNDIQLDALRRLMTAGDGRIDPRDIALVANSEAGKLEAQVHARIESEKQTARLAELEAQLAAKAENEKQLARIAALEEQLAKASAGNV